MKQLRLLLLDGMSVCRRVNQPPNPIPHPRIFFYVPIYTPGWREKMWSKKLGKDWARTTDRHLSDRTRSPRLRPQNCWQERSDFTQVVSWIFQRTLLGRVFFWGGAGASRYLVLFLFSCTTFKYFTLYYLVLNKTTLHCVEFSIFDSESLRVYPFSFEYLITGLQTHKIDWR